MDEYLADDDIKYDESFASDIIVGAAQEISVTASVPASNTTQPKKTKSWMKNRTPMMGMRMPMMGAGGFKKNKKIEKVKFNARTRTASRSFSRGVSNIPILTPDVVDTIQDNSSSISTNITITIIKETPPAVMEMITDEPNTKHIRLFHPITKYMNGKKGNNHKGYIIAELLENNEYGKALKEIGIENGWKLVQIGSSTNITSISYFIVKNQLANEFRRGGNTGYEVCFERPTADDLLQNNKPIMGRKPMGMMMGMKNQNISKHVPFKSMLFFCLYFFCALEMKNVSLTILFF